MSKPISNHFYGTIGEGKALISSLSARKEKFSMDDVVAITKDPSGKIVWLEKVNLVIEHLDWHTFLTNTQTTLKIKGYPKKKYHNTL